MHFVVCGCVGNGKCITVYYLLYKCITGYYCVFNSEPALVTLLSEFDAGVIFCVRYLMEINARSRDAFLAIAAMAPWSLSLWQS